MREKPQKVRLKYASLPDEEVEELLLARIREVKRLLREILDLLRAMGGMG